MTNQIKSTNDNSIAEPSPVPKKKRKIVDINPQIKFITNGSILKAKIDMYPTNSKYPIIDEDESENDSWNGNSGETPCFSHDSTMMVIDQAQYYLEGYVYFVVKLLCSEKVGWITVVRSSRAKEWDWMIPMKQKAVIQKRFDELFETKVFAST